MRAEIRDTEAEIDQMTEVGRAENQPGAETELREEVEKLRSI